MKNTTQLGVLLALTVLGITQARAQTTNISTFTTNVVLNANFSLTAYVQTDTNTIKRGTISSKGVLNVIEADLLSAGTTTNFSRKAALVAIVSPENTYSFAINDGNNLIDASSYLTLTQIGDAITTSKTSSANRVTATSYLIDTFHLGTSQATFDVQGLTQQGVTTYVIRNSTLGDYPTSLAATVSGSGSVTNSPMLLKGTVSLSNRHTVVTTTVTTVDISGSATTSTQ